MALPALTKTWVITPNNRITYVSLNDTMARYLFGVKAFLKTNGYTVRGSSDGTTGAMDLVDRWATFANVTTRATAAAAVQSWIVLRDGNGVDILLTYQGASDDIARISFSPGQLFVAAGTPTHQPPATAEQVVSSAVTLIGVSATVDRLWFGWVSSDFKMCRFAIARSGVWLGRSWGIEEVTPQVVSPAVFTPSVWGFAMTIGTAYFSTASGVARAVISGTPFSCVVGFGIEVLGNNVVNASTIKPEVQGGAGYLFHPLSVWSNTTSCRGKLGNVIDWWGGRTDAEHGSLYGGAKQFIAVASAPSVAGAGSVWPWNGVTTPILF